MITMFDGFSQCSELVVYFLQFVFHIAFCHYPASCLEPELVVAAYECAYRYRLINAFPVQADETYASSVNATVVWFVLADKLHCHHFRRSAQCSCREGVDECTYGIGSGIYFSAHTAHEVYHVAVILGLLVEIHFHFVAVAAKVVPC